MSTTQPHLSLPTSILAICGFQNSGKDAIAEILVRQHGYVKLSFAGVLKDIVAVVFGWDRGMLEGVTKEDREARETVDVWWSDNLNIPGLTPRKMLQFFGTDLFRAHFCDDIWVKVVERKLTQFPKVVITDCRFPNEISMIRSYGGKLVHVERNKPAWFDGYKAYTRDCDEAAKLHVSETSWIRETFDHTVVNEGTLQDLNDKVAALLHSKDTPQIKKNVPNCLMCDNVLCDRDCYSTCDDCGMGICSLCNNKLDDAIQTYHKEIIAKCTVCKTTFNEFCEDCQEQTMKYMYTPRTKYPGSVEQYLAEHPNFCDCNDHGHCSRIASAVIKKKFGIEEFKLWENGLDYVLCMACFVAEFKFSPTTSVR